MGDNTLTYQDKVTNLERMKREARRTVDAEEHAAAFRPPPLVFDGEESLRPVEFLIDGLLPVEGCGMLFGESDVGKTFLATCLAVHVAGDRPWLGRTVKAGSVLFFEAEGGRAFALRKHCAKGAAGLGDGRKLHSALPFVTVYQPLAFGLDTNPAEAVAQATAIRSALAERKLPPVRLVVVDTLSQNMAGDADNNAEMQGFLRALRAFGRALSDDSVFVLVLHHPGHREKERARGAYALAADLDVILHLEGKPECLTLSCRRMRDGAPFPAIALKLERRVLTVDGEPLRDERGREQTSLVVLAGDPARAKAVQRDDVGDAVLQALPPWPEKVGIQKWLVPKVTAILGRPVDHKTVAARCFALQSEGLAEEGPGRQKGSFSWGRTKPAGEA